MLTSVRSEDSIQFLFLKPPYRILDKSISLHPGPSLLHLPPFPSPLTLQPGLPPASPALHNLRRNCRAPILPLAFPSPSDQHTRLPAQHGGSQQHWVLVTKLLSKSVVVASQNFSMRQLILYCGKVTFAC